MFHLWQGLTSEGSVAPATGTAAVIDIEGDIATTTDIEGATATTTDIEGAATIDVAAVTTEARR